MFMQAIPILLAFIFMKFAELRCHNRIDGECDVSNSHYSLYYSCEYA